MSAELASGIIGGFIGGILGVLGTLISSYYGPRKFEEWRAKRLEKREYGPRKELLQKLLEEPKYEDGRSLEVLSRVTGTKPDECRRLLIEIGARGVQLKDGMEGWALISRNPISNQ